MTDPATLYKLMILYLLRKVNFPMTNAQVWTFFDEKGYTNYFVFKDTMRELWEANLIRHDEVRNQTRYEITREGEQALHYFKNDITTAVLRDLDEYIRKNQFQLRNETGITADYHRLESGNYRVHMIVLEEKETLFEINLTVPTGEQAAMISDHFEENAQEIYSYIMKRLV